MIRPPPMSTRTATLIPYPALFRAARSRINPQAAEYHRPAGKDEGGITLGRRHPPDRLDTALVQDLVFFWREIGARQRARNGGWIFNHGSFLRMCDGALDMWRPGVRPMIDPIGFWRLIIAAPTLAAPPKAPRTPPPMDDNKQN